MSKRIKDLEYQVAVLEAQRDRVRLRLTRIESAHRILARSLLATGSFGRPVARAVHKLMKATAEANHEYDRYYIEKEN